MRALVPNPALVFPLITVALAGCSNDEPTFADAPTPTTSSSSGVGGAGQGGATATNTSNQGSGGGGACVDFGEPCSECELAACEDRYCECYGNVDCTLYASCALECPPGDGDCLQACNTAHPDGITDAALLNDCAAKSCPAECEQFALYALDACETCLYESCESAMNACLSVPDCSELLFCLADCDGAMACENLCYGTFPGGIDAAVPVGMCSTQQCMAPCGS